MTLNVLATCVLAYVIYRDVISTFEMLDGPYESKGFWLVVSIAQILALFLVGAAVWL